MGSPTVATIALLLGAGVSIAWLIRKAEGPWFARAPLFLEVSFPLIVFGLVFLPEACPGIFAKLLGHSIDVEITRMSHLSGGTTMTETAPWVGEVWIYGLMWLLRIVLPAGFLCALVNLATNKNRPLNIMACLAFTGWTIFAINSIVWL